MKRTPIVCLALAIFLVVWNHTAAYRLGYSETAQGLAEGGLIFGFLVKFGLFACLLFLVIVSFFQKQRSMWPLYSLIAFWPLVMLTQTILGPDDSQVLRGLRDRVMHDYTLDDLRQFARDVNQSGILKNGRWINHGDTSGLSESEKVTYGALKQKYAFMHWLDDGRGLTGPSILNQGDDDIVNFEWGGALMGHWGCSISVNGAKNDPYPATFPVIRVSDDIYFFHD